MTPVPSFVQSGAQGESLANVSGNFVKFEENKPVKLFLLHNFEAPEGEDPSGNNSVLSYRQYAIYDNDKRYVLPEGTKAITFPELGGADDVGKLLGLKSSYRGLAIVMIEGEEKESVWAFPISVYKQLLEINSEYDTLKGRVLKVTRTGTGLSTKYNIVPTKTQVAIENEPETDLVDFVGDERTREDIIAKLVAADTGIWPPIGGDPYAPAKKTTKKGVTKPAAEEAPETEDEYETV